MNKKIIIAVAGVAIVLIGAFVFLGQLEKKVEDAIRKQIAQDPSITIEAVSYSALSGTASFDKFVYKIEDSGVDVILSANTMSITDFNTDLENTDEELPLIFGKVSMQDYNMDFKMEDQLLFNLSVDSIIMNDYAQNYKKLMELYEKGEWSEEFFDALLNYTHGGIEMEGYKFVVENNMLAGVGATQTNIERIVVDAADNPLLYSVSYENMEIITDIMNFKTAILNIDDLQIPNAKTLASLVRAVEEMDASGSQNFDAFLSQIYEHFSYTDSTLFSNISFEEMMITVLGNTVQNIENKEISMEKFSVDLSFDEKASLSYVVEDFIISPEYIALFYPEMSNIIDAFIPDDLVINVNVNNEYNIKNNQMTFQNSASVAPLFESSGSGTAYYKGQDFWSILALMSEDTLELVAYENMKNNYTDTGLIPLALNLIAMEAGLPVESIVQQVQTQLGMVAGIFKTGNAKVDAVMMDAVQAFTVMLDKPGSLDIEIQLEQPYSFADILTNLPTDFEVNIDVKEGSKTVLELTPKTLLGQ